MFQVFSVDRPETKRSLEQISANRDRYLESKPNEVRIINAMYKNGILKVVCENEETVNWL